MADCQKDHCDLSIIPNLFPKKKVDMISVTNCDHCSEHKSNLTQAGLIDKINVINENQIELFRNLVVKHNITQFPRYLLNGSKCDLSGSQDNPELTCENGLKIKLKDV